MTGVPGFSWFAVSKPLRLGGLGGRPRELVHELRQVVLLPRDRVLLVDLALRGLVELLRGEEEVLPREGRVLVLDGFFDLLLEGLDLAADALVLQTRLLVLADALPRADGV